MTAAPTLGLVVNPVAGMGGPLALKGSDHRQASELLSLGATPWSHRRAVTALHELRSVPDLVILTAGGPMGEDQAREAGLMSTVVYVPQASDTTSGDTVRAINEITRRGCDLLLFAGGDGTARDVSSSLDSTVTSLGIPAGVKIQSGVFASSPAAAGALAAAYLAGGVRRTVEAEVLDLDEEQYRKGSLSARLFGYLRVPHDATSLQGSKVRSVGDDAAIAEIAHELAGRIRAGGCYVVGPGSTAKAVLATLGLPHTLLGVDLIEDGKTGGCDLSASELISATQGRAVQVIVSPIGGQGFILGRGNQQLSPELIRRIGADSIIVVAAPSKLAALHGRPLRVDTGDAALDRALSGYRRVLTGYRQSAVYRVAG